MQTSKILIVEDDALIGLDIANSLSSFGYEIAGPIDSGEEAIEKCGMLQPNLILMDIGLKGKLDGIQAAQQIQDKLSVPVVFLTAHNDEETLQRAKLSNPYGYLIKPFDGNELHSTIELTLHRFNNEVKSDSTSSEHEELDDTTRALSAPTGASKSAIVEYLSQLSIFSSVSPTNLDELSQRCTVREYDIGEFISVEGERAQMGFIPITGRFSITKSAESGKALTVALLAPGDTLGLLYCFDKFGQTTSARAQVASRAICIPTQQWEYFLQREAIIYKNLVEILTTRLTNAYTLASSLAHSRVEVRVVNALLALLPSFGRSASNIANEGRIYMTRRELAELTGTTPETAIRVTKILERDKLLDLTRPGIIKIPDVARLRASASAE